MECGGATLQNYLMLWPHFHHNWAIVEIWSQQMQASSAAATLLHNRHDFFKELKQ
jgi:hypothetical protein